MSVIHCRIITPHGVYKETDASIINIESEAGQQGILPNHMPLVTMLKIGQLSMDESGKREEYAISGGLFYFRGNKAEILTDAIENKNEIDVDRATSAKERAERRLSSTDPNIDIIRAQVALERALNRLKVKGR
ncbi:MAG: ATP synthase F1 subunit epsilon [Solobacterium sp.]|nr:ATP synthase F1 subunit epsilon [Solobacterium sp.]